MSKCLLHEVDHLVYIFYYDLTEYIYIYQGNFITSNECVLENSKMDYVRGFDFVQYLPVHLIL